jgi:hypothetical protein
MIFIHHYVAHYDLYMQEKNQSLWVPLVIDMNFFNP